MTTDGPYPSSDDSHGLLHRAAWSIGDTAFRDADGLVWVVTATFPCGDWTFPRSCPMRLQ
jgi:hypothetical protein